MNEKNLRSENRESRNISFANPEIFREKVYPEILAVKCQDRQIIATLSDGRKVSIPVSWYPRTR